MKRIKTGWYPFRSVGQNRFAFLLYLLLSLIGTQILFVFEQERTMVLQIPPSTADVLCQATRSYFFRTVVGLITVYYVLCMTKYDFTVPFILRQKDKRRMWLRQSGRIAGVCLFTSAYAVAALCIEGRLTGMDWMNWGDVHSRFYLATETLRPDIPFWRVWLLTGAGIFLMLFFLCMLWLLCRWLTNRHIVGWLVMLLWISIDGEWAFLFIGRLDFTPISWVGSVPPEMRFLPIAVGCLTVLAGGLFYAKRKDFLNVQQR